MDTWRSEDGSHGKTRKDREKLLGKGFLASRQQLISRQHSNRIGTSSSSDENDAITGVDLVEFSLFLQFQGFRAHFTGQGRKVFIEEDPVVVFKA